MTGVKLMINWPALCLAGSTFWNKTSKSQLPINRISLVFFCAASTDITESNRMQYRSFRRTYISKLNFGSGRTGRMAGPASSTLIKLSLIQHYAAWCREYENNVQPPPPQKKARNFIGEFMNLSENTPTAATELTNR